jgi:hypothetical protein
MMVTLKKTEQILVPSQKSFPSSLAEPELMITDFAKFERPGQLHVGYQAIHAYQKKHSSLPKPWCRVSVNSAASDSMIAIHGGHCSVVCTIVTC